MSTIKKGLSILLALLFVVAAVSALLLFNLEQKAFTAETYQQAFTRGKLYQRLPAMMAEGMVATMQSEDLPLGMQGLTAKNWENFIRDLLPSETLKTMGDDMLFSLFAYLNGQSDSVRITLIPFKNKMASNAGTQAVLNLMRSQPDCTFEQIAKMTVAIINESQLTLCNLPQDATKRIIPLIERQLGLAAEVIPDEVSLIDSTIPAGQDDPRDQIQILRLVMRLSPLLPIALLFILTILIVRSLYDWLTWWGIPLVITGLVASLLGWIGAPFAGLIILRFLMRRIPDYLPTFLLDNISQLASEVVNQILKPVTAQGLTLAGLGLAMVVIAYFTKRATNESVTNNA